jgi:hypothetical protein
MSREVDALIVTVSDDSVIDTGLPLDRFDVLVQGTRFAGPLADRFDQVIGMLQPNSRHGVIAPGADERMARWDRVLGLLWPDEPPQPSPGGTM